MFEIIFRSEVWSDEGRKTLKGQVAVGLTLEVMTVSLVVRSMTRYLQKYRVTKFSTDITSICRHHVLQQWVKTVADAHALFSRV